MTNQLKIIAIITALALAGGGYYLYAHRSKAPKPVENIGIELPQAENQEQMEQLQGPPNISNNINTNVILKTNKGEIGLELLASVAPNTVANFTKLVSSEFYNGTRFHRVIKGFMIQGGDPLSKDDSMKSRWGTGGPGYKFDDELTGKETYAQGTLAMANAGPNTNGSQFFIVTASPGAQLPPNYTVFGRVISGMDVALAIENVKTGQNDQPVDDVVIESVTVK